MLFGFRVINRSPEAKNNKKHATQKPDNETCYQAHLKIEADGTPLVSRISFSSQHLISRKAQQELRDNGNMATLLALASSLSQSPLRVGTL